MSLVTGRPLKKGQISRIFNGAVDSIYPFQFNPTEVRRAHNADYVLSSSPGSALPIALFKAIQGPEIQFQLLLDSLQDFVPGTGTRELRSQDGTLAQQAELESFVQPDIEAFIGTGTQSSAALGSFVAPPELRLSVGPRTWPVRCTSLSFSDIMFDRDLVPIRTLADLSLRVIYVDNATLEAHLSSLNALRNVVVVGP